MRVFFNAASFDGQADNPYDGGQLLLEMMLAVEHLIEIGARIDAMYRDDVMYSRIITRGTTFKAVVDALYWQIKREDEERITGLAAAPPPTDLPATSDRFSRFIRLLSASPLATEEFASDQFECFYHDDPVNHTSIGYTAHFTRAIFEGTGATAVAISLQGCPKFVDTTLIVYYDAYGAAEERSIWHVTKQADVEAVRRKFEHNPKHSHSSRVDGMQVAAMDLSTNDAQRLLNQAAQLPSEGRLFARHGGRIYVFPCHNRQQLVYHGYPVETAEMKARMGDIYAKLYRHFGWPELA